MIYGDNATDFCVGEEIILAEPLLDLYDGSVIATNGDRMTIHTLEATKFRGFESWKIEAYDEFNHLYNIIALQEKEKDKFYEALQRYHKAGDNFGYWKLKESFLDIRLPYAVTCHKLQGSTFNRVLICGEDIMAVWEKDTRAKCAYVAVTRATEKIGFLE